MSVDEFSEKYETSRFGSIVEDFPAGLTGKVIGYHIVIVCPGFPSSSFSVDPESETYYNSNLDKTLPLPPLDRYFRSLWWINPDLAC